MASLTTSIFVRFSANKVPDGFDMTRYYQVYAIDVFDDGSGDQTRFLLSDKHGRYQWILSEDLRRFNPRMRRSVVTPSGTKPIQQQEEEQSEQESA